MPAKRATISKTEADLEASIPAAVARAFPWLPADTIKHQIKFIFDFGGNQYESGASSAHARLDVLLEADGKPLAILELKRHDVALTREDELQGLSYARLVQPQAPLVLVTNGSEQRFLATHTGEVWTPGTSGDEGFKALLESASKAASQDLRHAIDTLMGTSPSVWMNAVEKVTDAKLEELTATAATPGLPFSEKLLLRRKATLQIERLLKIGENLVVLEGAPLVGKSNVLRELVKLTEASAEMAILFVESGGRGVLQSLADALNAALNWAVTLEEARQWLVRLSREGEARLVIAVDGFDATDMGAAKEIQDLASGTFGEQLSLVLALDEAAWSSISKARGRETPSILGRKAKVVQLDRLDDEEYGWVQEDFAKHRVYMLHGSEFAPEYRQPWVLRASVEPFFAKAREVPDTQAFTVAALFGTKLIDQVRKTFGEGSDYLRLLFQRLARAMLSDVQQTSPSAKLVADRLEAVAIREPAVREVLSDEELMWLKSYGYVRLAMSTAIGPTYRVRLPELLASELTTVVAEELITRLRSGSEVAAKWLSYIAGRLPQGEVVAASALVEVAKKERNFSTELFEALLAIRPERVVFEVGREFAAALNGKIVHINVLPEGRADFIEADGTIRNVLLADEIPATYRNSQAWGLLSHAANAPFEVNVGAATMRGDPYLLLQIGQSEPLLRGISDTPFLGQLQTIEIDDEMSLVDPEAGIVEAVTMGILNYVIHVDAKTADEWVRLALQTESIPLLNRVNAALTVLGNLGMDAKSEWARDTLNELVLLRIHELIAMRRGSDAATPPLVS